MSSGQQDEDSQGGFNTEDGHRESQATRETLVLLSFYRVTSLKPSDGNNEFFPLSFPVNGSHGPGDTNTQEDIDSIGASNISNRVVSGIVLNSGGLGSKSVWGKQRLERSQSLILKKKSLARFHFCE